MKNFQVSLLVLVLLMAVMLTVWVFKPGASQLPEFKLSLISGQTLTHQDLAGKPALINFWSVDCPTCIKEIPYLNALHEQWSGKGLRIIGVAMNFDPPNVILAAAKARNMQYDIGLDVLGETALAFEDTQLTPTTFLVAPDGSIVWRKIGLIDFKALDQQLANWL